MKKQKSINGDFCHEKILDEMKPLLGERKGKRFETWKQDIYNKFYELLGIEEISKNTCPLNI